MVDLASLRISVDSRDVKKAEADLTSMASTAGATSTAVDRLSASNNRLAQAVASSHKPTIDAVKYVNQLQYELESVGKSALQLKALEIRMAAARAPTQELANEIRSMGAQLLVAERNAQRAVGGPTSGLTGMGNSSKLASHHVQNLAFQFQDMFVGLASGQKPMTVFMQQGTQIGGIMQQAGIGVGGLVKEIGRMTAAMAAAVLMNPYVLALAAAVGVVVVAFKDFQGEVDKSGQLKEYSKTLGLTAEEMKKLGPVTITAIDVVKGLWKTFSDGLGLEKVFSAIGGFFGDLFRGVASTAGDLTAGLYGLFVGTYRGIVKVWDMLPAAFGDIVISAVNATSRGLENMINKAIGVINDLIEGANKILATLKMPTIGLIANVDIPELQNQYAGAANKAANAFLGEITNATNQARSVMSGIGSTIGTNIIGAAKDRLAEDAGGIIDDRAEKKATDAAGKAGKSAGEKFAEEMTKMMGDLNAQTIAFDQNFMKEFAKAGAEGMKEMMDDIAKREAAAAALREEQLKQNIKTAQDGAKIIADVIGGSFGKGLRDLSDIMTKNFPDVMAEVGKAFDGIKASLNSILGGFGTNLKEVGAFIGVGGAAATMTGGSATGGAVGGAIGGAAGKSIAALGKFGGPIGAIAGGILGGIVGGLFAKTKQASATIAVEAGKLDVAGIVGNNAQFKATANTLAGAVIGGLNNAANALGAEITNAINISIGQRKDKFVLDLMGLGRTKGAGTMAFATEAEAITYAIDKAIRDGIFGGLRAGTERLLKGFGDVEDRLAKAVDFENVFKAMKQNVDPVGTALEKLDQRFKVLIQTFSEASATSEEWATLEKYYQQERLKTIEEANRAAVEKTNAARDALISAYDRESAAILTTLERFQSLTAGLESFRMSLAEQLMTADEIYKQSKAKFEEISKAAIAGNEQAIAELVSVSQRYLDAAKQFLTPEEYNREIQNVMKAVDLAIVQTKSMEEYAQSQLDALNKSVEGLMKVDESVISVADAIKNLKEAIDYQNREFAATTLKFESTVSTMGANFQAAVENAMGTQNANANAIIQKAIDEMRQAQTSGNVSDGTTTTPSKFASGGDFGGGLRIVGENGPELEATGPSRIYNAAQTAEILSGGTTVANQISNLREEMRASLYAIAKNTGKASDQLQRWDGDGLPAARTY